ncbi:TorF family putative porin [Ruficoccus sp. ZRK36]|uniref:TorF family putative porin n=1 Tax=Ruficoccus sp. ZRK36 TaxID=2866311 RepID=UPI001C735B36|nr:TorF family putative porin [Ruficoccus sp. ZRK36]QYY35435.1 hypothetical protein K0V07_14200 [Ruficoccus sp. ZRK36]
MTIKTISKLLAVSFLLGTSAGYAQSEIFQGVDATTEAEERETAVIEDEGEVELHAFATIDYESMYVTSGAQGAYESLQPNVEFAYYGFYAGVWANMPLDSNPGGNWTNDEFSDEYNIYAGYGMSFMDDLLSATAGATYYLYPDFNTDPNHTWELNFGIAADVLLNPGFELNYDLNLNQLECIIVSSYEFDLSEYTVDGLSLAAGVAFGYLQNEVDKVSYFYVEMAVDVVYTYNENFSVFAGPRFSTNDAGKDNNIGERATNF